MLRNVLFSTAFTAALLGSSAATHAEHWPQWRGPRGDGTSQETNLPVKWSKTENVAWRLAMPGPAGASPVVWGDQIFLTSVDAEKLLLMCVGTDGKEQWRRQVGVGNKDVRGDEGNSASPSPSTDGKHVWCFMANGDLSCHTTAGEQVWAFNVQERYGKLSIAFGMTSTPVLDGDRLYLQLIHGEGKPATREAMVVALEKGTGKEVWKQPRPSDAIQECEHSYASPILYRDSEREFLISHGADYAVAHALDDGRELWRVGGLNLKDKYNPTLRFVSSPVAAPGLIIIPSAKNGPVLALSPEGSGDLSADDKSRVWTRPSNTPDVPSPLIHDGIVYLCRENGVLIAVDAKTGEELYQENTHRSRHRASPVYADGKLYLTSRDGVVSVVKTGRTFELLGQNKMEEDMASSPALSNGRIYLRTFDALYAVENPK